MAGLLVFSAVVCAGAQGGEQRIAVQTLVIKGDPAKAVLGTIRLNIAPDTKIQAHSPSESALKPLPPGSAYVGTAYFDPKNDPTKRH